MQTIANNMYFLRNYAGLTQREFGDIVGVSQYSISKYESSSRNPSILICKYICDLFGLWLEDFCFGNIAAYIFELNACNKKLNVDLLISRADYLGIKLRWRSYE